MNRHLTRFFTLEYPLLYIGGRWIAGGLAEGLVMRDEEDVFYCRIAGCLCIFYFGWYIGTLTKNNPPPAGGQGEILCIFSSLN